MNAMRILAGADPHGSARTPKEMEYSVSVFEDAYELAVDNKADAVFWLGDLLHYKYGLELRLLLEWMDICRYYRDEHGIHTHALLGNHDIPWKDNPSESPIRLLSGVMNVYAKPTVFIHEGTFYAFLPWLPSEEFIHQAKVLAMQALQHRGMRFLFSHTSLAEGLVSVSNHQTDSPVRVAHLYPDSWTHIYLGDYHAHQTVGPKITYLGAPRPRTFGDWNNRGYWLLDVDPLKYGTGFGFTNLPLPSRYPEFIKLRIGPFGPPTIPDYNPINEYVVECAAHWVPELGRKYKGIRIDNLPGESVVPQKVRVSHEMKRSPHAVAKRWRELKGHPEIIDPIMEHYINICLNLTP